MSKLIPGTNQPSEEVDPVAEANAILSKTERTEKHKARREEKKQLKFELEKHIKEIRISNTEEIFIRWGKVATVEADEDEGEEESTTHKQITYTVDAPHKPHKDFTSCFKKLTKYAMELVEISDENMKDYCVTSVKIDGDMLMKKSRVTMVIGKAVRRTGKIVKINTAQVTMYGESNYENHGRMSTAVEELVAAAIDYMNGKCGEEEVYKGQFRLF